MLKISKIETFKIGMPLKKIFTSGNKAKNITRREAIPDTDTEFQVRLITFDKSAK